MIGKLPESLLVNGMEYKINTDYRNILVFLSACEDPELSDSEKLYILLKRLFGSSFDSIAKDSLQEAAKEAKWFVDCGRTDTKEVKQVKLIDWEQDEALIFSAINKIAGYEIRASSYMHWWTFMGYFTEIENSTLSTIISIRQKRRKGKKLESWELEFYRDNKSMCNIKKRYTKEEQEEIDYWERLLK